MTPDPLSPLQGAICAHPRFDAAFLAHLAALRPYRQSGSILNKISSAYARFHIFMALAALHYSNDTPCADGGASFERLLATCEARNLCGSRVLRTTLLIGVMGGVISMKRGEKDSRLRLFVPTEKMVLALRQFSAITLKIIDDLTGSTQYSQQILDDHAMLPVLMRKTGAAYFSTNLPMAEYFADLYPILAMDGGGQVVCALASHVLNQEPMPNPTAIAKEAYLSASQTRKVFQMLEQQKLIQFNSTRSSYDASLAVARMKLATARNVALQLKFGLDGESLLLGEPLMAEIDNRDLCVTEVTAKN